MVNQEFNSPHTRAGHGTGLNRYMVTNRLEYQAGTRRWEACTAALSTTSYEQRWLLASSSSVLGLYPGRVP
jgi:hypothetical protein